MSKVRQYIGRLTNEQLWALFDQMEEFEKTGTVDDNAQLRTIAKTYMDNNAMSMMFVGHEVWRELAQRGAAHTI